MDSRENKFAIKIYYEVEFSIPVACTGEMLEAMARDDRCYCSSFYIGAEVFAKDEAGNVRRTWMGRTKECGPEWLRDPVWLTEDDYYYYPGEYFLKGGEGKEWRYIGAAFLNEWLIPPILKEHRDKVEVKVVEGFYGRFEGGDALEQYEMAKNRWLRRSARWEPSASSELPLDQWELVAIDVERRCR